jgi:exonuclease SbcC
MLERLLIQGFQAHDKLGIRFDPAITTIVGDSDTGKSSIIRALRWVLLNKPRGDGFLRHGASTMRVKALIDDITIERKRNTSNNEYSMDGKVYKAFGLDTPKPIADLASVTEINFQSQHDGPFWFNLSASEVGRQLNKIVDLEVIDRTSTRITSLSRSLNAESAVVDKRLAEAQDNYEKLSYIKDADTDLVKLEQLQEKKNNLQKASDTINILFGKVTLNILERKRWKSLIVLGTVACKNGKECLSIQDTLETLENTVEKVQAVQKQIIKKIPRKALQELENSIEEYKGLQEELNQIEDLIERIQQSKSQIIKGNPQEEFSKIAVTLENVKTLFTEEYNLRVLYGDTLSSQSDAERKKMIAIKTKKDMTEKLGGICPLCGSEWNG